MNYTVERIIYEREGSGTQISHSRYSIVKQYGTLDRGKFTPSKEPKVLEPGLTLAEAKERVKVWRDPPALKSIWDITNGNWP